MPRKTYEINNREEGKAAQRDQSYRSCLIALLIFFFMCLILILACVPWKFRNQRQYQDIEQESQHHHEERVKETTTVTISSTTTKVPRIVGTVPTTTQTTTRETTTTTPTEDIGVITEDYLKTIKGSRRYEHYLKNTTDEDTTALEEDIEDYTTEILQYAETTEEDLTTLQRDTVTDINDNDGTSTSLNELITTMLKHKLRIAGFTEHASKSVEETTTDEYYSSEKSEVEAMTDYITTPTSSTQSNDFEGSVGGNSTSKFERLKAAVTTDNITSSTMPNLFSSTEPEERTNTEYSSENYPEKSQFDVTTSTITSSTSTTRSGPEEDRNTKNSTYLNYEESTTAKYNATLINENVTTENTSATTLLVYEELSTTTRTENEAENTMSTSTNTKNHSEITEKYNEDVISTTTEKYDTTSVNFHTLTSSLFHNHTSTIVPISYDEKNPTTTTTRITLLDEDTSVCETGHCKYIASRMLSYMNHSADPCDDFYEYACGGFEADPQLIDGHLVRSSRNYQRIASQMLKEKRENVSSAFATYYDSCVQYERNMNFNERIQMANNELRKMGGFYTNKTLRHDNYVDFTNLFAELILHHSALFFDIVPELDEYRPNSFTLKIGPTTYESPFETEYAEDLCSEDELETKGQYVDLEVLYNSYIKCKNNPKKFMKSIKKALTALNVFKDVDDKYLESEYVEQAINVINSVIMQGYFSHFPSKNEIREAYLMNNYSKINLDELQSSGTFVNWTQLIYSLTGADVTINENIQVYFHDALIKGLRTLEEFSNENPISLNNAIMGLYAHKLYHELILPRNSNVKNYCLQVAAYLLRLEASSLYVSSFTDREIVQMNTMTEKIFKELKETLKLKTEEAEWAKEEGRQGLLKKIDSLELALPVVSYFKNRDLLYSEYNVSQVILYDNYFNNSMNLLRRYRILMYAELRRQVGDPKQIWTYHATPFQSKAEAIYGLNLVVIPYGIIDSTLINDKFHFDYLLLATLGNLIAHQIAHHFDANGIYYWDQTRNTQDSLMYENEFDTNFDDYINCQKENLYQGPINMITPFTGQTVSFKIPRLTLNERLSEIMGLRLAYDTLALTRSNAEKRLPWIKLRIGQLYYLAYAQMYCTKTPLMSSYVSLHENEDLPSRIRVFVSASNNKLLGEAWNCPVGSPTAPNDICSVFPYIDFKETVLAPQ